MFRTLSLSFFIALAGIACGTPLSSDDGDEIADADGKEDIQVARPVGTFSAISGQAGDFVDLTLKSDLTFRRTTLIYCITTPCIPPETRGTFKFTKSTNSPRRYLRFYDEQGRFLDRYEWINDWGTLHLRNTDGDEWFSMEEAQPWCDVPVDCELQDMVHIACVGEFTCEANACGFSCASEPPVEVGCGGFLGLDCPEGLLCVDDPTDECDPDNGGADCGGICVAN